MTKSALLSRIPESDRQTAEVVMGTNWPGCVHFSVDHLRWILDYLRRFGL